jgi:predicted GNAT superfamily acetyltransferase
MTFAVRSLETPADYEACVQLQRLTWGEGFAEIVPESLLRLTQRLGGVAAGAFDESAQLAGFVYGITGLRAGELLHWSHMLAVRPELRDRGIGLKLKQFQRTSLIGCGVQWIEWTFDPLVARNAHFNLNRLGARVVRYVPDMYGNTGSALHAFGTDRFVVRWPVHAEPHAGKPHSDPGAATVTVEIPCELDPATPAGLASAREWRTSTRAAFLYFQSAGFRVGAFRADAEGCRYVLERATG